MVPHGSRPALALALLLAGCLPLGKGETRKAEKDGAVTPASYQAPAPADKPSPGVLLGPSRTRLSVAILSRPPKDPAVDSAVWAVADEQAVPDDQRAAWEANGLRVGLIRGSLPMEVSAAMNPEPPGKKADVVEIDQPDGEPTDVDLAPAVAKVTLLLARDGRTVGKDYDDARGLLRVIASRDGVPEGKIRLRLVPEIRHGPVQHGFGAAPTSGPFQPKEFVVKDGQAEEQFRDLAASVDLRPGQVLVVGARGDSARGLGGFLFHGTEPGGERPAQRLVLIWAQPGSSLAHPEPAQGGQGFRMFRARDDRPEPAKPGRN
jgi:hypothetical protein